MKVVGCLVGFFVVSFFITVGGYGVVSVFDARAHGESYLLPLAFLAFGLLGAAYLIVGILSSLIPAWRDGRHRGQKSLVTLLLVALPAAGLVVSAEQNVVNQRPDAVITTALAPACAGGSIAAAGTVDPSGGRINHLVVLDPAGREHAWTGYPPLAWRPPDLPDADYVACIGNEDTETVIQTCQYQNGSPITRYRASRAVSLVEARTGLLVTTFVETDDARSCGQTEQKDTTTLKGEVSWAQVQASLAPWVDPGGISGADGPGASIEPTPATPTQAPSPTSGELSVNIAQALGEGLVEATIVGDDLQHVTIELESLTALDLKLTLPAGTFFDPRKDATQSMVSLMDQEYRLAARDSGSWDVEVACAEMRRDQPSDSDRMTIRPDSATGHLADLLALPALADQSFRVQQFAIWTLTNNPTRNNYLGLGSTFNVSGGGPDKEEFATIRDLLEQAGINPRDYRAFH